MLRVDLPGKPLGGFRRPIDDEDLLAILGQHLSAVASHRGDPNQGHATGGAMQPVDEILDCDIGQRGPLPRDRDVAVDL